MNRVKVEVIAARTGFLPSCLRFFSCSSGCRPWWRLCLVAISPRISDRNGEEAVYGRRRTAPRRARLVFLFLFSSRRSGRIGDYLSGGSAAFSFCFVFSSFFLLFLFLPRLPCAFIFLLWFWFFFSKHFLLPPVATAKVSAERLFSSSRRFWFSLEPHTWSIWDLEIWSSTWCLNRLLGNEFL